MAEKETRMRFCVGTEKKEKKCSQLVWRIIAIARRTNAFNTRMSRGEGFFAFCAQLGEISLYINSFGNEIMLFMGNQKVSKIKWWLGIFLCIFQVHAGALCVCYEAA
jgi:hypothetical protein